MCVSNDYFDALGLRPGPGAMNCLENVLSQTLGGVWFSKMAVCRYQKHPTPALNYSPPEAIMNENDESRIDRRTLGYVLQVDRPV